MESTARTAMSASSGDAADRDDSANYRTLSILALASLVLGLAGPLCMAAPLLMAIPLTGAVLAIAAIVRIDSSAGLMLGRGAAVLGLILSVASICAAYTRAAVMEQLLSRQARNAVLQWVQLLEAGDVEHAFELTVEHAQGPPPAPPGEPGAAKEPPPDPLKHFRENPVVVYLTQLGTGRPVRYLGDLVFAPGSHDEFTVIQEFSIPGTSGGEEAAAPSNLRLTMQRVRANRLMGARWLVDRYERAAATPAAASRG